MAKAQITGGGFQDIAGNPLTNGYLLMSLSQDAQTSGGGSVTGAHEVQLMLDVNGNIPTIPAVMIWPNDQLTPVNTVYIVSAYSAQGELVWGPNSVKVISSSSPFNIGESWTPPDYGGGAAPNFVSTTGSVGTGMLTPKHATLTPTGPLPTNTFTLPDQPYGGVLVALFYNVGFADPSQYTLSGNLVILNFMAQAGDILYAIYF